MTRIQEQQGHRWADLVWRAVLFCLLAGLAAPVLCAGEVGQRLLPNLVPMPVPGSNRVVSDFDRDNVTDDAYLSTSGTMKRVAIRMGNSRFSYLSFTTQTGVTGTLSASDIDNDNDIDLVWTAPGVESPTILLGDGNGNFTRLDESDRECPMATLLTRRDAAPAASSPGSSTGSAAITSASTLLLKDAVGRSLVSFQPACSIRFSLTTSQSTASESNAGRAPPEK